MNMNFLFSRSVPRLLPAVLLCAAGACSSLEDNDYYSDSSTEINNDELKIVNVSSEEYIKSRSDLTGMDKLFTDNGIYDELTTKGQLSTILVVTDDNFSQPQGDDSDVLFVTKSHVSDISISPANLHDGDRLMMWHEKYVSISIDSIGQKGYIVDHIKFNNGTVKEIIKTESGYIYVISEMIDTPTSLSDFINDLGDDYSIFKEMVLSSGGKEFDVSNSKAIGVNAEGNTVYDSVFIYTNAHFEEVDFDMTSESLTATMLLFSNDVIEDAISEAHERLALWGMEREDSVLLNWIRDVAFFSSLYTASELQNDNDDDLTSIFSKQWRTNAHKIDGDNPTELSNGIVYEVKQLHLPNNLLMYRLKDWFYYYEYCTDEQKAEYFKMTNMVFSKCNTDVTAWSPWEGVWPAIEDRVLILAYGDEGQDAGLTLDFTPLMLKENASGGTTVTPYTIPPGTYRLAMGSKQNQNMTIRVSVLVNGTVVAKSDDITLGSSTTYHYDRGTALSNRYPEGYDPEVAASKGGTYASKASNYDTDGGPVIDEVEIPDLDGKGTPSQIVLRIEADNWNSQSSLTLNHWCLRPTVNNY